RIQVLHQEEKVRFDAADRWTRAFGEWTLESRRRSKIPVVPSDWDFRIKATEELQDAKIADLRENRLTDAPGMAILLAFPALCIIWAFLTRGGLTSQVFGLALQRADGRPASRLQCALRALLSWLPLILLLVLALGLQDWYWSQSPP